MRSTGIRATASGKGMFVAALFTLAGLLVYMVLLATFAGPTSAQNRGGVTGGMIGVETTGAEPTGAADETTGAARDQYDGGPDEGCANPQVVETFAGTENQLTDPFRITGDTFRLRFDVVEVTDPNGFPELEADVLDNSGEAIGQGFLTFQAGGSENIIAGPGTFSLDVRASDVRYEITVEDCAGVTLPDDRAGEPGDDTVADSDDPGDVVPGTVPQKDLPVTGGLPLLGLGIIGVAFLGTGLSILGFENRRIP